MISKVEYVENLEEIQTTGYVKHKLYGEGMVLSIKGDVLEIEFSEKTAKCKLRFMMEHKLIE